MLDEMFAHWSFSLLVAKRKVKGSNGVKKITVFVMRQKCGTETVLGLLKKLQLVKQLERHLGDLAAMSVPWNLKR